MAPKNHLKQVCEDMIQHINGLHQLMLTKDLPVKWKQHMAEEVIYWQKELEALKTGGQ